MGKKSSHIKLENGELYNNFLTKDLIAFRANQNSTVSRLTDPDNVVESIFTFVSGDTLAIVCEYIDFYEEEINI